MKVYNYIKLVILVAFSILLFIFKEELVDNIHYFIGALVLAFGVENIIILAIVHKKECFKDIKFSLSLFELVFGLTILVFVRNFEYVCVMWAAWSLTRQAIDIHLVINGEVKGVVAIVYILQSIVSVVFSIILIVDPTREHAISHIYLLIAELLVIALPPVVDELLIVYKTKKNI